MFITLLIYRRYFSQDSYPQENCLLKVYKDHLNISLPLFRSVQFVMDGLIIYAKNSNNIVCTKNTQNVVQLVS